jgi:hypothetical protein
MLSLVIVERVGPVHLSMFGNVALDSILCFAMACFVA